MAVIGIDYNLCFDCTDQLPPLSMLQQATQSIPSDLRTRVINAISRKRLLQVLNEYGVKEPDCLSEKTLNNIKNVVSEQTTIRKIMHGFYGKDKRLGCSKASSDFPLEIGPEYTLYDPLDVRPVGKEAEPEAPGTSCDMSRLQGYKYVLTENVYGNFKYLAYQVRYLYDWVFLVKSSKELEKGRFFKSLRSPGWFIWKYGKIDFFDSGYLSILPETTVHPFVQTNN